MRRWKWVVVGLLAITMMVTAVMMVAVRRSTAQEDDWSAVLYDAKTDSWWMRAQDGSGRLNNFTLSATSVAVNTTGTQLAYCALDDSGQAIFHVFDPDQQTDVLTSDLGPAVGCQLERNAFSPNGARVWVGLSGDQPAWQLLEVQVSDGTIISTLDSDSSLARFVESTGGPMMPHVLAVDDEQVVFGVTADGVIGAPDMPAYRWKPTGDLSTVTGWGRSGADGLLATKEVIWPDVDPDLPIGVPSDLLPAYNIVQYLDNSGHLMPIYHSPEWVIRDVAWVNRGQQVAIGLISPDDVTPTQVRWVLVNRDGSMVEHDPVSATSIIVMDSRDGYAVYTVRPPDGGTVHAVLQRFIGDDGQIVAAFDEATAPELRWVTPSAPAPDLLPFVPFALAQTPEATPTAGFTSTPSHVAVTASYTPTPTNQQAATNSSVRTATPIPPTNTRAPSATSGIRPPSSRTHTPTSAVTSTRVNSPTSRPASATPRTPSNTSAPGSGATSTPRRGQLASPTPNTGPTTRPASATPTFTPSRTRTPTMTFTPTRDVVPSKTPLPTTSGLPTKTPIRGPTTTLSYGGGNETRLYITNNAGTDLCEIYFTPNTESTWGENYLEQGEVLADGDTLSWVVEPAVYDVKVFDCFSNSLEEFGFDLTDGSLEVQISSSAMIGVPR